MVRVIGRIVMVGLLGALISGCALRITVTPVDKETITQQTLGNKLWDWMFEGKKIKVEE